MKRSDRGNTLSVRQKNTHARKRVGSTYAYVRVQVRIRTGCCHVLARIYIHLQGCARRTTKALKEEINYFSRNFCSKNTFHDGGMHVNGILVKFVLLTLENPAAERRFRK